MEFRHYLDSQLHATDFKLAAFDLEVRRQAHVHGVGLDDLPRVLERLAARQRRRLQRSEARLRERGNGVAVATVPAEGAA